MKRQLIHMVVALAAGNAATALESEFPVVVVARLDDEAITPVTARFIVRAVGEAERLGAEVLVLVLDTPGGLLDSTRAIVREILRSAVPVAVFVPPGGRAASAGMFVTLASHVAAMAPGSTIGAAHPVSIGGLPVRPEEPEDGAGRREARDPAEAKAVEDTTAWARALAELRGRNAEWAARAVRESASASATEAVEVGVVEFLAQDIEELLEAIDGREVATAERVVEVSTGRARLHEIAMWWGEEILAVLANPNVAFLLMLFGFYGILFELYTPGWGVAGTLGLVCLVLAGFSLSMLPINYVGLALVGIGLALFIAEAFVTSYGALTAGGIACLALGGLMLVDSPQGFLRVSAYVVIPVALATGLITVFLVAGVIRAHRERAQTGSEALVGLTARATHDFHEQAGKYAGHVAVRGEYWNAESVQPVREGERVVVQGREGLTLTVERLERTPDAPPRATDSM